MATTWSIDPDTGQRSVVTDGHVVLPGPITGSVTTGDGTMVDVSPDLLILPTQEQANEVATLIGERYEAEGHDNVDGDFVNDADTTTQNLTSQEG